MMLILFLKGFLVGLLIAMPLGPIDMVCIRKTLLSGMRAGFITGLGAAFADAIYAVVAVFGMTALTSFLVSHHFMLQMVGGTFLIILGIRSFFVKSVFVPKAITTSKLVYAFVTTFFLALTSPLTIISFVGAFAALGVGSHEVSLLSGFLVTLGVFLGSTFWWFVLSTVVTLFKNRLSFENFNLINDVAGGLLVFFGVAVIGITLWQQVVG